MSGRTDRATGVGLVLGYAVMTFAVVGLLRATSFQSARDVATWVIGGDLLHDLVVAPAVCLTGFALARLVSSPWRWPVRAGAIGTALVLVVAYPALRGFGRGNAPGNRSVLPLDYVPATLTVLAVVWGLAIVWGSTNLIARRRGRSRQSKAPSSANRHQTATSASDDRDADAEHSGTHS